MDEEAAVELVCCERHHLVKEAKALLEELS
jgi:hypothetical protein